MKGEKFPGLGLYAGGWAAFSLAHERCDCPTASTSQESSPSSGRRPLNLPGTERKPALGMSDTIMVLNEEEEEQWRDIKKRLFNERYKYYKGTVKHTHKYWRTVGPEISLVDLERLNEKKASSQRVYFDRGERSGRGDRSTEGHRNEEMRRKGRKTPR